MASLRHWPALLAGLLALLGGCSVAKERIYVPSLDPDGAAQRAISEFDTDHDGVLSGKELDRCPGLKACMSAIDLDKDHRLTREEIAACLRGYQKKNIGLWNASASVTLDGKPVAGALVTLVPENFLGGGVDPASGTTDIAGGCDFKVEGSDHPGAQPGIYRVQVSKKDSTGRETIAPRYNTETILGAEVGSMTRRGRVEGITLKLSGR